MGDNAAPSGKSKRLSDVVREVKVAAAEREDVVVDMKEADRARLELLAEELTPVFAQVPDDDDQFDFVLSSGLQPRLWIDAIAHVQMGPDRRTYRFVRDSRFGRVVLSETSDPMRAADSVTHYVAERIVQRQRFLASDERPVEVYRAALPSVEKPGDRAPETNKNHAVRIDKAVSARPPATPRPTSRMPGVLWFLLGALVGAGAIALAFREQIGPILNML